MSEEYDCPECASFSEGFELLEDLIEHRRQVHGTRFSEQLRQAMESDGDME